MAIVVSTATAAERNYGTLLADLADWLARDDLDDKIIRFVQLAESDLCADLRIRTMETNTTYSATGAPLVLPTGFLGMRSLHLEVTNDNKVLTYMPPERFNTAPVNDEAGNPSIFTIIGNNIRLAPAGTPEAPVNVRLYYIKALDELVNETDTNSVLSKFYDVYLYAALKHAFAYIRDDEQAVKWAGAYNEKVNSLNRNANRERFHGNKLIRTGTFTP